MKSLQNSLQDSLEAAFQELTCAKAANGPTVSQAPKSRTRTVTLPEQRRPVKGHNDPLGKWFSICGL